jgi:hypothetical protein
VAENRVEAVGTGRRSENHYDKNLILNDMEKTIMNISSIILALVAVALLGISVYSLLSYIKERRAMRFKSFRQR